MNRIHQRTFVFQSHAKLSISFIFEYTALSHSLQLTNRISTIAARISYFLIGSGLSLQLILNHSSFIYPPHWANTFCYTKKRRSKDRRFALALSIFPGRRQPSIVDRNELNYRVRNGNGWTLILISTNYMSSSTARKQTILYCPSRLLSRHFLSGDPYRIRTDVNGVRGRCLNHLTNGPWCAFTDSNRGPTD